MTRYLIALFLLSGLAQASDVPDPEGMEIIQTSLKLRNMTERAAALFTQEQRQNMGVVANVVQKYGGGAAVAYRDVVFPEDPLPLDMRKTHYTAAMKDWRDSVAYYVAKLCENPSVIAIEVDDGQVAYVHQPRIPECSAGLDHQYLILDIRYAGDEGFPSIEDLRVDAAGTQDIGLAIKQGVPRFILLDIAHLPEGTTAFSLKVSDSTGETLGRLPLTLTGKPAGSLNLEIVDAETGEPISARVGLYSTDGFILPQEVVPLYVHHWNEAYRHINDPAWPSPDRRAFYSNGGFSTGVPAGSCRIVLKKGVEYELVDQTVDIVPGNTTSLRVEMKRWVNMPREGWYASDDHVHVRRNGYTNTDILNWVKAEGVHVSNIVQMDDIIRMYFLQYAWGESGMAQDGDYILRSGQEAPRTQVRGHTIQLNVPRMVRNRKHYYLYEEIFDEVHALGGMTGYAHFGSMFAADRGLYMDLALDKIDFVETLQMHRLQPEMCYKAWNMGFRITPLAGSDFPWGSTVGEAMFFVKVDGDFSFDAWYQGVKQGHVFLSDGPMLEFTVDDALPGDTMEFDGPATVTVRGKARMNPTLGKLQRLELLQFGEVIQSIEAEGEAELTGEFKLDITQSTWLAARAYADDMAAHTAAVYIMVNGKPWWQEEQLAANCEEATKKIDELNTLIERPDADKILQANAERLREYMRQAQDIYSRRAD